MRGAAWAIFMVLVAAIGFGTSAAEAAPQSESESRQLIEAAATAYTNGQYSEAIRRYEKLVEQVPHDPALLYNLGTAYAQAGRRGLAVWRYLQALRMTPRDGDLRANLRLIAPSTLYGDLDPTPIPPVNWLHRLLTANEWAKTAMMTTVIALMLAAMACWRPRATRSRYLLRQLAWSFGVLALVSYPFALTHHYYEEMSWQGVVVAQNTEARTGPSENQLSNFSLPEGRVVHILENIKPGWLKVSFAGGKVGFVQRDHVRFL